MLTASIGSHRFESGPTYHYNASTAGQLTEIMFNPGQTTDYINTLPGVNASKEEIQQVAAAGIVRLAVSEAEYSYVPKASKMLLDVCSGETDGISKDIFKDPFSWEGSYLLRGALSNAIIDSASVLATRKNNAVETAGIIDAELNLDEGIFIIGLANGGIISAAHTFLKLNGGNNDLTFIRYSRHKNGDQVPNMYPYPNLRKECLKRSVEGRQVIVYDEDYSSGKTLRTAVECFANLFDKEIFGIAPVEVKRRITYKPLVIKSE